MLSRAGYVFVFFVLASALFLTGCSGAKAPKDFPKTLPYKITVLKDGKPIEGVSVRLSTSTTGNWTASGGTDTSGVAVMQTVSGSYSKKGVPEGSYKVILAKPIAVDPALLGPEPTNRSEQVAYNAKAKEIRSKMTSEIPSAYSEEKSTPVTIEVAKGKSSETIDVGKQ